MVFNPVCPSICPDWHRNKTTAQQCRCDKEFVTREIHPRRSRYIMSPRTNGGKEISRNLFLSRQFSVYIYIKKVAYEETPIRRFNHILAQFRPPRQPFITRLRQLLITQRYTPSFHIRRARFSKRARKKSGATVPKFGLKNFVRTLFT